jgi:thioredoxin-like negative regulator of GroEL
VAEEIRSLVEAGTPVSLMEALERIRGRGLQSGEFGRTMSAVIVHLMRRLYPGVRASLPPADPPQTHAYTRIFHEVERGNYAPPTASARDYLELVLPFLALLQETSAPRLAPAEEALARARSVNGASVLAPYFLGLLHERTDRADEALLLYGEALRLSQECYPAALGVARILEARGQRQEAIAGLRELEERYPDNDTVQRQLAAAYYRARDWAPAETALAEALRRDPRDSPLILARAHALVEQGKYLQAQTPLDAYGSIDPYNRLYLFLRARVQDRGYRNREAALNYLRSILRASSGDAEAALYAARLLLESGRAEDQAEGRELLAGLLENPSPEVMELAVQEAIHRQAWGEAQTYLAPLLRDRRSSQDLLNSYAIERGLGNNAAALQAARELYQREPSNDEGIIAYIAILIDTGRQSEARRIVDARIEAAPGGTLMARYYHLRSRLGAGDDQVIADLRSSLFEDPRNLDALIDMVEVYHRRKDERRVVYYLRLALAIAPENPRLRRWRTEYAALLGANP